MKAQVPALTLAIGAGLATAQRLAGSGCDDVHVFIAKGNNEPYPGRQGKLVAAICDGIANCDYEDIQFYNPLPAPYCQSVAEGARNGVDQITEYNARCPDTKLVVSGYSQGGQVAGDILGGGGGVLFEDCQQPGNAGIPANSAAGKKSEFPNTSKTVNEDDTNRTKSLRLSSSVMSATPVARATTTSTVATVTVSSLVLPTSSPT
jgi:hypothetical protein